MSQNALAGTCTVTIDGVSVNVAGTFKYSVVTLSVKRSRG